MTRTRPAAGYIDIYPLMRSGLASPELKAAILAYLDPEVRRPMGDHVSILDPEGVTFEPSLLLRVSQASSGMEERAAAAVASVFDGWRQVLGAQVAPSDVTAAVRKLATVIDVETSGFAFTDLARDQFAVLGGISIEIVVVPARSRSASASSSSSNAPSTSG